MYFGRESYSGSVDTFWDDDVAIDSKRVGCSATGGGSAGTATSVKVSEPTTAAEAESTTSSVVVATSSAALTSSAEAPSTATSSVAAAPSETPGGDDSCEVEFVYV